jgi:hypothetical protein
MNTAPCCQLARTGTGKKGNLPTTTDCPRSTNHDIRAAIPVYIGHNSYGLSKLGSAYTLNLFKNLKLRARAGGRSHQRHHHTTNHIVHLLHVNIS